MQICDIREIFVEQGAGLGSGFPDAAYEAGLQRMRDDIARGVTAVESPFAVLTIQADRSA